jgi:hypothetical protein
MLVANGLFPIIIPFAITWMPSIGNMKFGALGSCNLNINQHLFGKN